MESRLLNVWTLRSKSTGSLPHWRSGHNYWLLVLNTPSHLDIDNIENGNVLLFPVTVYALIGEIHIFRTFVFHFFSSDFYQSIHWNVVTFTTVVTMKIEPWRCCPYTIFSCWSTQSELGKNRIKIGSRDWERNTKKIVSSSN